MNLDLYKKCVHELDLTISIFKEQNRLDDFSDFKERLQSVNKYGKGSPILNIAMDLRSYVYNSNILYIENMKTPSGQLTVMQQRLFDYYMAFCEGKQDSVCYTPTQEELKYLEMIKTVNENDIKFAVNLELDIFRLISKK